MDTPLAPFVSHAPPILDGGIIGTTSNNMALADPDILTRLANYRADVWDTAEQYYMKRKALSKKKIFTAEEIERMNKGTELESVAKMHYRDYLMASGANLQQADPSILERLKNGIIPRSTIFKSNQTTIDLCRQR